MPCLNPDGQITDSARRILSAMERPVALAHVAEATGLPTYRIRSAVRELVDAGFAADLGGVVQVTSAGLAALGRISNAA
jgi:predicted transcriptional regulator